MLQGPLRTSVREDARAALAALGAAGMTTGELRLLAADAADRLRATLSAEPRRGGSRVAARRLEDLRCYLHDTTLQVLEFVAAGGYGLCETPEQIAAVAVRAADDLRRWCGPSDDDGAHDLFDDLRVVVEDARRFGLAHVLLQEDGSPPQVAPVTAEAVTAAVREALTNVRKHARAETVRVRVASCDEGVEVSVLDDGIGILPGVRMGVGLPGSIMGRVGRVGGRAIIASAPGLGTEVRIVVGPTA